MQIRKSIAALGLTAGLVGGAVVALPAVSGAQDGGSTTTVQPSDRAPRDGDADGERPRPQDRLRETLAPLVQDGTLTQAQADEVVETLVKAAEDRPARPPRHRARQEALRVAADALDMEPRELLGQLRDGMTLAQVAEAEGKEPQVVVDALVADVKEHLDQAVDNGRLTRAEADERLARATERITDRVNNGGPRDGDHQAGSGDTQGD